MSETTTEQLVEIEGQPQPIQVREGRWRTRRGDIKTIRPCEPLQGAYFVWPWTDGIMTFQDNGRHQGSQESAHDLVEYLGPIEPQPEPETTTEQLADTSGRDIVRGLVLQVADLIEREEPQPEPQPEPVPEPDAELRIRLLKQANDSQAETIGRLLTEARDLNMEIGGLERQLLQRDARIRDLEAMHAAAAQAVVDAGKVNDKLRAQADELRSEVSYVQRLLGESRQRVTQLEELVGSLRTINEAQEKSFNAANKANTDLQHRLNVVAAEWAEQAETSRRLQIELDAAQQVPPAIADRFEEGWNQGTARAIETVLEWLEPIRLADSAYLANATMQHLPSIMRHLTGLAQD